MTMPQSTSFKEAATVPIEVRHPRRKTSYWLVPGICLGALIWVGIIVTIF